MKNRKESKTGTEFDPPIRKSEEGRYVHVKIDLPGITEEKIRIDLERKTGTLSISEDGKTFRTEFEVPQGSRFFKKKFSDGVLEIVLEKPGP
jgi:HSP20 family molecular chaperone IbpA